MAKGDDRKEDDAADEERSYIRGSKDLFYQDAGQRHTLWIAIDEER
jgi:hypothetical protein